MANVRRHNFLKTTFYLLPFTILLLSSGCKDNIVYVSDALSNKVEKVYTFNTKPYKILISLNKLNPSYMGILLSNEIHDVIYKDEVYISQNYGKDFNRLEIKDDLGFNNHTIFPTIHWDNQYENMV